MKKLFFITFLSLLAATLFAQTETKSLSLDEALNLALKNNISIQREKISLETAQRASVHSWNSLLPSISVSANDEIELPQGENTFGVEGKISLSISSDLFASMKKAKLDYEAKQISFDEAVSEITATVKESYFSLLLAKQNLDFLKENLENAKIQAEQNEERYRRGTLSEMEYLSSKVSYEKLKPDFKSQELAYQKDFKTFCLFLGLDEGVFLSGNLEDFIRQYESSFDENKKIEIADAVSSGNIPSVLNLKKQIEAALKEVSAARLTAYGPNAVVSYSASPALSGINQGQLKQSASIGISIPLENLLPFSKGADSIQSTKDSVNDLQLQLKEKSKTVSADYSHIIQSLSQKEESLASLKNFVNLAQKNYEATKFAYSKGMTEFLSMQNASKENLEAKMNLQNELLETLKLYISLEKLYGGK